MTASRKKKTKKNKKSKKKVAKKKPSKKKATKKKSTKKKATKKKSTKKKATKKKSTKKKATKKKSTKKKASKKKSTKKKASKKRPAKKKALKKKAAKKKALKKIAPKKKALKAKTLNWDQFFTPLDDRVLVRKLESEQVTAGGIIIPDSAQEKPTQAKVISVGRGHRNKKGKVRVMDVKAGDTILFSQFAGSEINIQNEDVFILRETDILGVID